MIAFNLRLLPRCHGVTIENSRSGGTIRGGFNGSRVGELGTVIREDDREEGLKVGTERLVERVNPNLNIGGRVSIAKEGQHQFGFGEYERQEGFATNSPDDGIHLNGL